MSSESLSLTTRVLPAHIDQAALVEVANTPICWNFAYLDSCFSITPINSFEDIVNRPKELILDYRLTLNDTEEALSYLKGIALDPEYIRSQLFFIKKDSQIIGIITLFCIPYKQLHKKSYLTLENSKLISKPISELLKLHNPDSFVIETGWLQLLSEYQNQKLGTTIVFQFLIPKIKEVISKTSAEIFILCSAKGLIDPKVRKTMFEQLKAGSTEDLKVPKTEYHKLGKINPKAIFSFITAEKMKLSILKSIFNYSLGPVFIREVLPEEKL